MDEGAREADCFAPVVDPGFEELVFLAKWSRALTENSVWQKIAPLKLLKKLC